MAEPERPDPTRPGVSRKNLLRAAVAAAPATVLLGAGAPTPALAREQAHQNRPLTPTPTCDDGDDPTPPQMEGPYFKPNSPRRTSLLEPGDAALLTVSGYVFGLDCAPLAGVLLDFWQADTSGGYDMAGYRYRGHQYTDERGAFTLETVFPGLYPGRTRHLHVKAQAPGRPVLTTQLYFPDEPRNATDALFDPALLMTVRSSGPAREGSFDFVLDVPGGGPGPDPDDTWRIGVSYRVGDTVVHGGTAYRCLIAHQAIAGWEPPNAPALWQPARG
ncbi:carbohydrate-binding protein [Streptomyces profundus]|uniref:carbohydrate-binding protein n=1 Tax=Streptomyces profundus TaxID=2867410 RepID=UPI001D162EC5|nr:carbohydrate-binding protein [Streptomyces sp. MA3_2.13]UED86444.1 dioxygenase [Streptomyces sp. MA3_2.13]